MESFRKADLKLQENGMISTYFASLVSLGSITEVLPGKIHQ